VSNSLARLRELFSDPLLVRSGRGLVPTPRAEQLAPLVEAALEKVGAAFVRAPLDPALSERCFCLACPDGQQIRDVPRIAKLLGERMPHASLRVLSIDTLLASGGLASTRADAALAPPPEASDKELHFLPLYTERAVVVVRRDHPRVKHRVTRALFNSLEHVDTLIALGEPGSGHRAAERAFAQAGLERRVTVAVPSFVSAAMTAAHTDLAATLPEGVARVLGRYLPIKLLQMPVRGFSVPVGLIWHTRTEHDVLCQAFRKIVEDAIAERR
jgi:DNA-binding transcriptional LysR family regulator